VLTTVFIRDFLIKTNSEEAKSSLLVQNNIISSQITSYFKNIDNIYTYEYIEDIIKQHTFDYNSRTLVLDTTSTVVIDSYDEYNDKTLSNPEIVNALSGSSTANIYMHNKDYILYAAVPMIDNNEVIGVTFMSSDVNDLFNSVRVIIDKLLIIFTASIILSLIVSLFFSEIIALPIEKLTDSVKKITLGNYHAKVAVRGNDEISALGNAFNLMSTKLFQVDDRRKKFVSNVSHELRTPMTSMKIVAETLLSQDHWEEEIYREFLFDINQEVDRLNKIIDSLLYLAKIEKDELDLDLSVTYVNYLIEKVIKTIKPIALKKNITLQFYSDNKIQINLDQEKMQQCLLNIVGNAVKYTPEDGMVTLSLKEDKGNVIITITDNGIGIPDHDLPYVFDRFYRVDEARARKTGGTGLGLSIAQQIVQLHQGLIEVQSEMGVGTTVAIIIPVK
jgi:signal transduction histidine kinase